jgi:hypothetical protein
MAFVPGHGRSTNAHLTNDRHFAPLALRKENGDLLVSLRSQAVWHATLQPYDLDHYQLHTHPDLVERLEELGHDCPAKLLPVYGISLLVRSGDRPFALAVGTGALLVKLSEVPEGLSGCDLPTWFSAAGWVGVDPWQSDLQGELATERLRLCIRAACAAA